MINFLFLYKTPVNDSDYKNNFFAHLHDENYSKLWKTLCCCCNSTTCPSNVVWFMLTPEYEITDVLLVYIMLKWPTLYSIQVHIFLMCIMCYTFKWMLVTVFVSICSLIKKFYYCFQFLKTVLLVQQWNPIHLLSSNSWVDVHLTCQACILTQLCYLFNLKILD